MPSCAGLCCCLVTNNPFAVGGDRVKPFIAWRQRNNIDLLAGKGDADKGEPVIAAAKSGDVTVVKTAAIADTPAGPVEGGKRCDDQVRQALRRIGRRMTGAEASGLKIGGIIKTPKHDFIADDGRQNDAATARTHPLAQGQRVDFAADRPEQGKGRSIGDPWCDTGCGKARKPFMVARRDAGPAGKRLGPQISLGDRPWRIR